MEEKDKMKECDHCTKLTGPLHLFKIRFATGYKMVCGSCYNDRLIQIRRGG